MNKKFIVNLALLLFVNLLVKPFYIFGIDKEVQNAVGPSEYGIYSSLFSFSIVLNVILDLGITNFNSKNIAQHKQLLNKYFPNILLFKSILAALYGIICIAVALIVDYNAFQVKMLLVLAFNQFLLSMIIYLRSNLSGLHLFKTDSLMSITDRLLLIVFTGALLYLPSVFGEINVYKYALLQTLSYGITLVTVFIIVKRYVVLKRIRLKLGFIFIIFKQSYPYALLILLMSIYTRIDLVMIERLLDNGSVEAGIYTQGYRLLDAASMFAYLFATLLLPMFARLIAQKLREQIRSLARLSFLLLFVPSFIVAIVCSVFSFPIMESLYNHEQLDAARVFSVLIFGFVPIATTYVFGTLLTANGSMRNLNIMGVSGIVVNIGLNLLLIPKMGALGAAWASVATQFATALIQVFLSISYFGSPFKIADVVKLAVFVLFSIGVVLVGVKQDVNWLFVVSVSVALMFVVAFLLKLIDVKGLFMLVKSKEM